MRIMNTQKTASTAILALALVVGTASVATAGRGGSNSRIQNAVNTGSSAAIIAEIERAERLICGGCIDTVMALLDDSRYEVREAAAWWFARRPAQKQEIIERSVAYLAGDDSIQVRNAADALGAFEEPTAIPALAAAAQRTELTAEARMHAVRALGDIGHQAANPALSAAMQDSDPGVRLAAVSAWLEVRRQAEAAPVVPLLADSDALVRRKAAAVVGSVADAGARAALEDLLASDDDPVVRRNAAWALGQIGDAASRAVLEAATDDPSSLVRMTAKVALRKLR